MKTQLKQNENMVVWSGDLYPIAKLNNYTTELENLLSDKEETKNFSVNDFKVIVFEIESCKNFLGMANRLKI